MRCAENNREIIILEMGNQNEKKFKSMHKNSRLGTIYMFHKDHEDQTPAEEETMYLKIGIDDFAIYQSWQSQIKSLHLSLEGCNQILLPTFYHLETNYCQAGNAHQYLLEIAFPKYLTNLADQIKFRKQTDNYFQEKELWYLLLNLVKATLAFQTSQNSIGDIHPNNVLFNQLGQIKILTKASLPYEKDNLQKIKQSKFADVFLSPEQIALVSSNEMQVKDQGKSDSFCIGMTMLQAISLQDSFDLYDRSPLSLNKHKLEQRMEKIINEDKIYGVYFLDMICLLLQEDPNQRKSPFEIKRLLTPYLYYISELLPFETQDIDISMRKSHYSFGPNNTLIENSFLKGSTANHVDDSPIRYVSYVSDKSDKFVLSTTQKLPQHALPPVKRKLDFENTAN